MSHVTRSTHRPLGPGGSWKTGQRCPEAGQWVDQHGQVNHFDYGSTFPPCISPDGGEVAFRLLFVSAATGCFLWSGSRTWVAHGGVVWG
jgi:hypothetical protein